MSNDFFFLWVVHNIFASLKFIWCFLFSNLPSSHKYQPLEILVNTVTGSLSAGSNSQTQPVTAPSH